MANYFKPKTKKKINTTPVTLTILRLNNEGVGVAKYQGKPVFIAGALVGEQVVVQFIEEKSKYIKAKLINIVNESQHRQLPLCQHYQHCGGCNLQHFAPSEQLIFKQQKLIELFNRQGIDEALPWQASISASPYYYRRKARIGVQYDKTGQVIIGFRRQGSNHLQPIKECVVLAQPLNTIFAPLKIVLTQLKQHKPIGHIEVLLTEKHAEQINNDDDNSVVSLTVRQLKPMLAEDKQLWLAASKKHNWQLFIDDGETISLLGADEQSICNTISPLCYFIENHISNHIENRIDSSLILYFQNQDFIQVNADINQQMIQQALRWLTLHENDIVLDLFCGLGNFSLPIALQTQKVVGIEGVDNMVKQAQQNADKNKITNAEFYQADLNDHWLDQAWAKQHYSKVVLDPARAGALGAVKQLISLNIEQILYISCEPTSLAQDIKVLLDAGYIIEKIALMDMFTHTKHCETMVLLSRR